MKRYSHVLQARLLALCLMLIGLLVLTAGSAFAAITTQHVATDVALSSLIATQAFSTEGRIGDDGTGGDFELAINANGVSPLVTGDATWPNGVPVPFIITYDATQNLITFTVGDQDLTFQPTKPFTDIFIRTRAVNSETSMLVDHLAFNGTRIDDVSNATNPPDRKDILWIHGADLSQSFALTGKSTMSWSTDDPTPTGSDLQYLIKFATIADPAIHVEKEATPQVVIPCDTITYQFTVSNPGPFPLHDVTVIDDKLGDLTDAFFSANGNSRYLDVGQSVQFTVESKVTSADPCEITNTVTVTGVDPVLRTATDCDSETVKVLHPAICVTKTADRTTAKPGDIITYTIVVKNIGDVELTNISLCDTLLGSKTLSSLCPGSSLTVTLTYTVPTTAKDAITNTVTVHANPVGLDRDITASASTTVTIVPLTGTSNGFKPDINIRLVGSTTAYGKDIFNSTAVNQTITTSVFKGTAVSFQPRIENDGSTTDTLIVKGPAGSNGWTIRYYNAVNGGTDITSQVTGSGWVVSGLAPNGVGARDFKMVITSTSTATGASREVILTVMSQNDISKLDVCKAVVTLK